MTSFLVLFFKTLREWSNISLPLRKSEILSEMRPDQFRMITEAKRAKNQDWKYSQRRSIGFSLTSKIKSEKRTS